MSKTGSLLHPVQIGGLTLPGNLFLAPVAGYSDYAFRSICAEFGASFAFTEMVSAEALVRNSGKTKTLMARARSEKAYAVQLFGADPATVGQAARIVLETTDTDCLDINAGCPVPKIVKTGAGAALTRDPDRLFFVVQAAVNAVQKAAEETARKQVPVTVKIRAGWDASAITWKEAAEAAIQAGAAAVTLHPRTRAQGYEGKADWNLITRLKASAGRKFPAVKIFGSGDLFSPEDAQNMLQETGCDGVMFARGALGNPFIFCQTAALLSGKPVPEISDEERIRAGWREFLLLQEHAGEALACMEMRKRFCAYTKGIGHGAKLRDALVRGKSEAEFRKIFTGAGFSLSGIQTH